MTLTDPREALADQSNFIGYLVGVAGLGRVVKSLAADDNRRSGTSLDADDFVHMLLGIASLAAGIERLANFGAAQPNPTSEASAAPTTQRWLK